MDNSVGVKTRVLMQNRMLNLQGHPRVRYKIGSRRPCASGRHITSSRRCQVVGCLPRMVYTRTEKKSLMAHRDVPCTPDLEPELTNTEPELSNTSPVVTFIIAKEKKGVNILNFGE